MREILCIVQYMLSQDVYKSACPLSIYRYWETKLHLRE